MSILESPALVVINPKSTRAARVKTEVLDRLHESGVYHDVITTKYPHSSENIRYLIDAIDKKAQDDTIVFVASGDGVTQQTANALLEIKKSPGEKRKISLAPLGYGNFNDMTAGKRVDPVLLLGEDRDVIDWQMMSFRINNEPIQHAVSCINIGLFALIAKDFSSDALRQQLQTEHTSLKLPSSLLSATRSVNQHKGYSLPPYRINNTPPQQVVKDLAVINNGQVGGIFHTPGCQGSEKVHYWETPDASMWRLGKYAILAVLGRLPIQSDDRLSISFLMPAENIPIHVDGEYIDAKDVSSIDIRVLSENIVPIIRPRLT